MYEGLRPSILLEPRGEEEEGEGGEEEEFVKAEKMFGVLPGDGGQASGDANPEPGGVEGTEEREEEERPRASPSSELLSLSLSLRSKRSLSSALWDSVARRILWRWRLHSNTAFE